MPRRKKKIASVQHLLRSIYNEQRRQEYADGRYNRAHTFKSKRDYDRKDKSWKDE